MPAAVVNQTMCYADLLEPAAGAVIDQLNRLVAALDRRGVPVLPWTGTLPVQREWLDLRWHYRSFPGLTAEERVPWFCYWQVLSAWRGVQPMLRPGARVLYAGPVGTLLPCFLAAQTPSLELHCIDTSSKRVNHFRAMFRAMQWQAACDRMELDSLEFPEDYFDAAFLWSAEHGVPARRAAWEVARCLKPGAVLAGMFPHRSGDVAETVLADIQETRCYDWLGQPGVHDRGETHILHPAVLERPYTLATGFLRKKTLAEICRDRVPGRRRPLLSVIVCSYNRADRVRLCLTSLAGQTLDPGLFEIILVDNNSRDHTPALVEELRRHIRNLRYVLETQQGLSHARNRGCAEARGTYLAYVDDDAWLPPHYLETLNKVLREQQPDLVGGPVYPYYTERKPAWFQDKYEIREYAARSGFSRTCGISGSNFVIRKTVLQDLGLFDVRLGMQAKKMGFMEERKVLDDYRRRTAPEQQKIYYCLECFVKHHTPAAKMTRKYILWRCFATARDRARISRAPAATVTSGEAPVRRTGRKSRDWFSGFRFLAVLLGRWSVTGERLWERWTGTFRKPDPVAIAEDRKPEKQAA